MTETVQTTTPTASTRSPGALWRGMDRVWLATLAVLGLVAVLDPPQAWPSLTFTAEAVWNILPFLVASVLIAAWTKATGLDQQIARATSGHPAQVITLAAVFGALSPFCSCGVVPIIAALLAAGVPLAPVMAFWLASPLMDPQMFLLMLGVFGWPLTLAKTGAAVALGLVGGWVTLALVRRGGLADAMRPGVGPKCCAAKKSLRPEPVAWRFWREPERRATFSGTGRETGLFLLKWLTLAFLVESLMLAYVPADVIGAWLGGDAWWAVPLAAVVGIPAYLNGYAAVPTVAGLIDLGMVPAAGLAFMLAGGVTSIPAAMAVFALVRRQVFALYVSLGLGGAVTAGLLFSLLGGGAVS
ncbi:permease [uncultured Rhodospira sp.]|uniref:permease n=1 Tax=uncultured Rhodospira sp. TaxID=1936189 RepID=UPI00260BCDA9|nr:permease [uncultured Rhodospira sp.]